MDITKNIPQKLKISCKQIRVAASLLFIILLGLAVFINFSPKVVAFLGSFDFLVFSILHFYLAFLALSFFVVAATFIQPIGRMMESHFPRFLIFILFILFLWTFLFVPLVPVTESVNVVCITTPCGPLDHTTGVTLFDYFFGDGIPKNDNVVY